MALAGKLLTVRTVNIVQSELEVLELQLSLCLLH